MEISKLLEREHEGEWATLETEEGTELEGELEITREYTDEQRKEIYQNAQYLAKEKNNQADENTALEPPEDSYIPNLRPTGDIMTAEVRNPFENYTVKITMFDNTTHITLKEDKDLPKDINIQDTSIEQYEDAITRYNSQIDLEKVVKLPRTNEKQKRVPS